MVAVISLLIIIILSILVTRIAAAALVQTGLSKVLPGDTLLLYGRAALLEKLDVRVKGASGDRAHDDAVLEQQKIIEAQRDI